MSRLTDLIAEAKAKDAQMGVDLERELRTLSARLPLDLNCRKLQFRISVQPAEAKAWFELYPYLETGDLLEGRAPELYKKPWGLASAASF